VGVKQLFSIESSYSNNTSLPLAAGATWTGQKEKVTAPSIVVAVKTDQAGTLTVEQSIDGTNWDSALAYDIAADTNEVHRVSTTRTWVRVSFQNTSASPQTYLRLATLFGNQNPLTSALNSVVQDDADALIVREISEESFTAEGKYQGRSIVNKFGTNSDLDTATVPEDIWEVGGTYTGFPTSTLETVEVLSSSANDAAAGTGARTLRITGLDGDYNVQSETVTLNGTTPVSTVNTFRRVHTATVLTAGSGGVNAGTLTVRHTTTEANVFLSISIGRNQSNCSAYTVPAGYTAYMRALHCSIRGTGQAGTPVAVEGNIWVRPFGGVFRSRRPFVVNSNYRLYDSIYGGLVLTEKTDVVLRITSTSADNVSVTGGYDLILVANT
jgi:hypothetical protein